MVAPLLRTLVGLHAQHIIHRDIKPENIFLTARQEFKLGDFGLAIQSSLELPYTRSGTLDYLSPEVTPALAKQAPPVLEGTRLCEPSLHSRPTQCPSPLSLCHHPHQVPFKDLVAPWLVVNNLMLSCLWTGAGPGQSHVRAAGVAQSDPRGPQAARGAPLRREGQPPSGLDCS